MIYQGIVSGTQIIENVPSGNNKEVQIYTDADVSIAFWMPDLDDFGAEIEVAAPGGFVGASHYKARITGSGANVRLL
jgi:hypothetical protein